MSRLNLRTLALYAFLAAGHLAVYVALRNWGTA